VPRASFTIPLKTSLHFIGFLAGSEVKENGDLNAGLRKSNLLPLSTNFTDIESDVVDQDFALRWVQSHVSISFSIGVDSESDTCSV
jgi:hypothetical protein